ncbi:hypothetical protein JAAARDRAFT_126988 [Jaapia argillacea MUCL 33604]|uniref:PIN domain-containing protein n=1 Tax=Jaapia argillacea MUCL 33604 TaxID=933084 RepID=A0A067QA82_9AGAM|nr:hypothetical protein JAAARDRAFT_126988 [Jaapia argillacea MUCL 33604]
MNEDPIVRPSRKGKEREQRDPAPTDLAERLIALQRRTAGSLRQKERSERVPASTPASRDATAASSRPPQERSSAEKPPSSTTRNPQSPRKHLHPQQQTSPPRVVVSQHQADHEDFSRRLKISNSPRTSPHPQSDLPRKLFNPETDPIPMRRTAEPESISDTLSSSSYVHAKHARGSPNSRDQASNRQLFDHRKDDPVRFSVFARPAAGPVPSGRPTPTPKSSGDYVSASSTSSYAHSLASSSFTLSSSTTDGSSTGSALFDQNGKPSQDSSGSANNAFSLQLKKLYRAISCLETKVIHEETDLEGGGADEAPRDSSRAPGLLVKQRNSREVKPKDEEAEKENERWRKMVEDHKCLAEMMHNLLEISLAPSVPASLRNIPQKYNIIMRLWTHAFNKLLENLRRASCRSPIAFEHLQEFIYYAYTFYTGLLEEQTLAAYRSNWLECLGDLARYRMVVTEMVSKATSLQGQQSLTAKAVAQVPITSDSNPPSKSKGSISDKPAARIDDESAPSIGVAAARAMDVEPEKERWRIIAREWYATALGEKPGEGKLHHHLGLLSREVEGEDLRSIYHFVKGMTTLHPFQTARESVLSIWSPTAQARRSQPDARVQDLFVFLHGMLFTNIQLDDFPKTVDRFLERLDLDGAEERDWIMMAVVNIGSILEYGRPSGMLRKTGALGLGVTSAVPVASMARMKLAKKEADSEDKNMDVDDDTAVVTAIQTSPTLSNSAASELPLPLKFALQLTFAMLSQTLRKPTRKSSPFARSTLNPYITVILTFLSTILKHHAILEIMERSVPWEDLANFFSTVVPKDVTSHEELTSWMMLTSGCKPLPEDWCVRGMEWVGRKVFERGFWNKSSSSEDHVELEVLDTRDASEDVTDGIIEDEDEDEESSASRRLLSQNHQRWLRTTRAGLSLAKIVGGFDRSMGTREWRVSGPLAEKVARWSEEDRLEREQDERRRRGTRWGDDSMDVDEDDVFVDDEESEDDDDDTPDIQALKARRHYLRSLLQSTQRRSVGSGSPPRRPTPRKAKATPPSRPLLNCVPGYTVLVVDTNILLSSLSMFASLVEKLQWTVVVPLPVIMELDGLSSSNAPELSHAASAALSYITSHIRSHSLSLKVLTSKGNYLTTLSIRTEQVDFSDRDSWDRSMDDLILRAALWQDEHWVDRSALLKSDAMVADQVNAVKVVLLSFDRNLRLKARSRQLNAATEKDLAAILATSR